MIASPLQSFFVSRATVASVAALAILAACAAPKPPSAFEEAFDDDAKPWTEVETQIPAPPRDADLIPFQVNGASVYRFDVDARSLSVGTDGVFRYTLVAISPEGVRNVSYEGIRCETHQQKIYAIGRADGSWVRARTSRWQRIEDVGVNRQHVALDQDYFCPNGYAAADAKEIVARMNVRSPGSERRYDQTQFQQLQR